MRTLPTFSCSAWVELQGVTDPFGRRCKFSFSIYSWLYKAFFSRLKYASYSCFPLVGNFAMLLFCFPWGVVYIVYVHVLWRTCVFLFSFFYCSDAYCFQFGKILRLKKSGTILHTFQVLNIKIVTFLRYSFTFHCHGVTVHNSLIGQSAFLETSVLALGFMSLHHVMSL